MIYALSHKLYCVILTSIQIAFYSWLYYDIPSTTQDHRKYFAKMYHHDKTLNEVRINIIILPLAWSIFRWSTVICRISAFSSFAEPCFSKAVGTRRLSSIRLVLMRSRRRFSMTPRRFLRLISWQSSPGEEHLQETDVFSLGLLLTSGREFKVNRPWSWSLSTSVVIMKML